MKYYLEEFWVELAVAVVLFIGTMTMRKIPKMYRSAMSRRFRKVIAHEAAKHMIIQMIHDELGTDRVALVHTHNGGGIPKIGSDINVTIDWEEVKLPLRPIKNEWQSRAPDSQHLQMLLDLTRTRKVTLLNLEEEGEIKDSQDADAITMTIMHELTATSTDYWYLSLSYIETRDLESSEQNKLNYLKNNLQKLLSKKATLVQLELWSQGG